MSNTYVVIRILVEIIKLDKNKIAAKKNRLVKLIYCMRNAPNNDPPKLPIDCADKLILNTALTRSLVLESNACAEGVIAALPMPLKNRNIPNTIRLLVIPNKA